MTDELHLQELGERKIALFCCIPDSDKSLNYLVGMIYTQLIQTLYRQADRVHKGRLPVPVHCLMDEYANISLPKDTFLSALATMRSRAIFCSIIVQNMAQLKAMYKDDWESLVGLCDEFLYLGGTEKETHKYVSELLGKETISTTSYNQSKGRSGSYSINHQQSGRDLMTPDEVRLLDNSKCMDNRKMAEEIVRLVGACHGHALVLFTSYRQMAEVRALTDGQWQYPTYQAWRNGGRVIQQFKESGNGVLFAAGSCWEGIDFPGDMVSLLIIAKLPFPIPDPVSDYERRQYPNLRDYINAEIIPEMQKKLRQGFGRAIRTEQDSCVVAILDERAGIGGRYHDAVLAALPTCPITEKIEDVQQFIREQKRPDYFL